MKNYEALETVPIFVRIDHHKRIAHVVSTDIKLCLYFSENNKASRNIGVDPQRGAERHKCRLGLEYARFKSHRPGKLISATSNKNVIIRQCTMYIVQGGFFNWSAQKMTKCQITCTGWFF